jgi:hypothetical protein
MIVEDGTPVVLPGYDVEILYQEADDGLNRDATRGWMKSVEIKRIVASVSVEVRPGCSTAAFWVPMEGADKVTFGVGDFVDPSCRTHPPGSSSILPGHDVVTVRERQLDWWLAGATVQKNEAALERCRVWAALTSDPGNEPFVGDTADNRFEGRKEGFDCFLGASSGQRGAASPTR